jgi:hypothetical protein
MKKAEDHLDETKEPLFPPVLPSWGGMLPNVPSAGYGDVSFDPGDSGGDAPLPSRQLTERDREMIDRLPKILSTKQPA